ncbi:MAG: ATP-dependent DNA helicase [Gammaproteobacteria bacterium]|nr:ATP-dependent DNA helicase [Gammaproteobacteria bacterium]
MLDLQDIFGSDGPLQRALPDFRVRREQLRMAERVAQALAERGSLIVEAGTGTGKTFAYLVPALLSGRRVLISTGTRALQDQLFSKDLPLLGAALGRPARVALLKGRANYLCRYRLERLKTEAEQLSFDAAQTPTRAQQSMLARIRRWAHTTERGDLAEVRGLSDDHPVWPLVTSTRETCLGPRCPQAARCHVVQARRDALEADVVIVNHHLLLADLALKEDGFGDLLGAADAIILDEAHQIPDLATQFFGARVSDRQVEALLRDLRTELTTNTPAESARAELATTESALQTLRAVAPTVRGAWSPGDSPLGNAVQSLRHSLEELAGSLAAAETGEALQALGARCAELAASLERINAVDELEGARTLETYGRGFALTLMPFDISTRFRTLTEARGGAWVFTSATLSVGAEFGHFSTRLGLESAPTLQIESPFDHERQSLLYLPQDLPAPASPAHTAAVIDTAEPLIRVAGGGTFVLFTSHRALSAGAALLRARWQGGAPYRLLVQGEAPRERMLEEFRRDGNAVLLGTASFWEGVDVKGTALRLVIIEKLPFASPEDPLVRARIEHLNATGGNPFRDFQLPEAALALKQGAGRLIRSEDDYGVVVICDPRMVARAYGRVFLAALPPMSVTRDAEEVRRFLARHGHAPARVATAQ